MSNKGNPLVDQEQIKNLIPQRPPILLVDQLVDAGEKHDYFITSFKVPNDHVFVSEGLLREPGLIENLAQSAATGIGYKQSVASSIQEPSASPDIGYIGAIKNLTIQKCPEVGQHIRTVITVLHEIFDVVQVRGELWAGDDLLAKGDMKVFQSNKEDN